MALTPGTRFGPYDALNIAMQIADALEAAHEQGIVPSTCRRMAASS